MTNPDSLPVLGIDARKAFDFGIGSHVRGLIAGLAASQAPFRFVIFGPEGVAPDDPRFRWVRETTPGYSLRELWALSRHARAERLDLFHALHYVLPAGLRCRTVVTLHDVNHLRRPEFLPTALGALYADRMIRRALQADQVIAVSRATADDLRAAFGVRGDRLAVVHNGIDERFFEEPAPLSAGTPDATGCFLFVGNPKPHKNLDGLLVAMTRQRHPSRLAVAGSEPSAELVARVRELGLASRVRWLGFVRAADLPGLYRSSLALVLVSKAEGFGLPVAEAMACGRPVVISRLAALLEVAGEAGLAVDGESPEDIAGALDRLQEDAGLRLHLGEIGRQRAAAFRWQRAANETVALYQRVLTGPQHPPDPPESGGFPRDVFSLGRLR